MPSAWAFRNSRQVGPPLLEDQQKLWAQGDIDRAARGGKRSSSSRGSEPLRECPLPSRRTLIRQVPQLAGASLGTHGRIDVRADRPDGASSCEISSAIGEHRQVAREVRLTSEPAAISVCLTERSLEL